MFDRVNFRKSLAGPGLEPAEALVAVVGLAGFVIFAADNQMVIKQAVGCCRAHDAAAIVERFVGVPVEAKGNRVIANRAAMTYVKYGACFV